jgi:formate hydrogenlyase subunit 6/NADH:ubiquinone oxidoreductase subunit I
MAQRLLETCPVSRGRGNLCSHCRSVCPAGLEPNHEAPAGTCLRCGSCDAACPLGALPPRASATGHPGPPPEWTAACSRVGDPARSLVAPCLGSLGIDTLLQAVEDGAKSLTFQHGNCSECRFVRSFNGFKNRLPWIEALLESCGLEPGHLRLEEAASTLSNPGRRDLFRGLFGGLRKTDPEEELPRHSSPSLKRGGNGKSVDRMLQDSPGLPGARVELDQGCTLCGICVCACPTGAFRTAAGTGTARLEIVDALCINCRTCVALCPQGALAFSPTFRFFEVSGGEGRVLASLVGDLCKKCGTYMPSSRCPICDARTRIGEELMHVPEGNRSGGPN